MSQLLKRWRKHLADREWREQVREVRERLRVGMKVVHVDEAGGKYTGLVMNVRYYSDGSVEGFFYADNHAKGGWKPATTFLPVQDTETA